MFRTTTKEVDLGQYPLDILRPTKEPQQIVFGDLHGNALKLIYILIQEGALELSEAEYQVLVKIYHKDPAALSKEDLAEFKKILQDAMIDPQISCLFLGDTLADRGMNDYYTLLIYEKLTKNAINFSIIFSNHDLQFMRQYEIGLNQPNQTIFTNTHYNFGASLSNMQALLSSDKISLLEVNNLVENCYLPNIRLIDTAPARDVDGNYTLIYSHTPITPSTLLDLIILYNITIHENSSLHDTIHQINTGFLRFIYTYNINYTAPFENEKLSALLNDRYADLTPFDKSSLNIGRQLRWGFLEKYRAVNIHGHVGTEAPTRPLSPWTFINMDTPWGMPGNKMGAYKIAIYTPLMPRKNEANLHHSLWSTNLEPEASFPPSPETKIR